MNNIYNSTFNVTNLFAHTKPNENLLLHSNRTLLEFNKIKNNLIKDLAISMAIPIPRVEYLSELGVFMHDFGKGTPYFQEYKMDNIIQHVDNLGEQMYYHHSMLSAILFLNEYMDYTDTLELNAEEVKRLDMLAYIIVQSIAKHHGKLTNNIEFKESVDKYCNLMINNQKDLFKYIDKDISIVSNFKDFVKYQNSTNLINNNGKVADNSVAYYIFSQTYFGLLCKSDIVATKYNYNNNLDTTENRYDEDSLTSFCDKYKDSDLAKFVKDYKNNGEYTTEVNTITNINKLRNNIAVDVDTVLKQLDDSENIYYLESSVGSGKTHISTRIALAMLHSKKLNVSRVFYCLPFTSISEQVHNYYKDLDGVTRLDSKTKIDYIYDSNGNPNYELTVQNHQFLNNRFSIITFVALFDILFSNTKSASMKRLSLQNSVIILDEIQSIDTQLLNVFINLFNAYAEIYNFKIIFMSATLPRLSKIIGVDGVELLGEQYRSHELFSQRNKLDFNGKLNSNNHLELLDTVIQKHSTNNRIIVQCITKNKANIVYESIKMKYPNENVKIYTGDTKTSERNSIISDLKNKDSNGYVCKKMILVTTNCIEAGVDIDMNLAIVDYSFLDSLEQLSGRVNRNNLFPTNDSVIYIMSEEVASFMSVDKHQQSSKLSNERIKEIFSSKNYDSYFNNLLQYSDRVKSYKEQVKALNNLNFKDISKNMKLITKDNVYIYDATTPQGLELKNEYENLTMLMKSFSKDYNKHYIDRINIMRKLEEFKYEVHNKFTEMLTQNYSEALTQLLFITDIDELNKLKK